MSRSNDKRIAELELNNKNFETNAKTSLSTIQKLKNALKPDKSEDFFDVAAKSAASINLKTITDQLEDVKKGFSGFSKFTAGIFKNMADDVYKYGKSLWNNTVGQIQSGGSSRALNIANAKFKLEGLGVAWEQASKDINQAVDGTAYGFDAAASSAARLATAGIKLGEGYGGMAHSLRAISGIAAMTNSSYEEIGYIFSQIASAGRLMGQDAMQISTRGVNVTAILAKQLGKTTTEILEMQRKGEISFAEFAEAMNDAFGDQATKANETFQGAVSNVRSALSRIGEVWYGPFYNAAIKPLNSIRVAINKIKKAFDDGEDSTRDFKNRLTDIMDIASRLISYVIEHLDLSFFQDITNAMAPIMESLIHVGRMWENFLGITKGTSDATKKTDELKKSVKDLSDEELELAKRTANGEFGNGAERVRRLKELTENYELVQQAVNECVAAGWDWAAVEEKIAEERKTTDESYESLENGKVTNFFRTMAQAVNIGKDALQNIGSVFETVVGAVFNSFLDTFDYNKVATDIRTFAHAVADVTAEIKAFIVGNPEVKENIDTIFRVANNLYNTIRSIAGTLAIIISRYVSTFFKTFDFTKLRNDIYAISRGLSTLFGNLFNRTKNDTGMEDRFTRLWMVVNNLYRILSAVGGIIVELLTSIGIVAKETFGDIGSGSIDIVKITDAIAKWVEGLRDYIRENKSFIDATRNVFTFIMNLPGNISKAFNTINDKIEEFTGINIKETVSNIVNEIGTLLKGFSDKVKEYGGIFEYISHLVEDVKNKGIVKTLKDFFSDLFSGFKDDDAGAKVRKIVKTIALIGGAILLIRSIKNRIAAKSDSGPQGSMAKVREAEQGLFGNGNFIINLLKDVKSFLGTVKNMFNMVNTITSTLNNISKAFNMALIIGGILAIVKAIAVISEIEPKDILKSILVLTTTMLMLRWWIKDYSKFLSEISNATLGDKMKGVSMTIAAIGASLLAIAFSMKLISKIENPETVMITWLSVESLLFSIIYGLRYISENIESDKITKEVSQFVLSLSASMVILAVAVRILSKLNVGESAIGVGAIVASVASYVGALYLLSKFSDDLDEDVLTAFAKSMLSFSASAIIMGVAIRLISKLEPERAFASVGALGILLLAYAGCLALIAKFDIPSDKIVAFGGSAILFGVGIGAIAASLKILSGIKPGLLWSAVGAIAVLIAVVGTLVGVLGYLNTGSMEGIALVAATLAAVFVSIGVMVAASAVGIGVGAVLFAKAAEMWVGAIEKLSNADLSGLSERVKEFSKAFSAVEDMMNEHATTFATAVATFLGSIFSALLNMVEEKFTDYADTIQSVAMTYVGTIINIITQAALMISSAIIEIADLLLAENEEGESVISQVASALWGIVTAVGSWLASKTGEIVGFFMGFVITVLNAWSTALEEQGDVLTAAFVRAFHNTSVFIQNALTESQDDFIAIGEFIINYIWDGCEKWAEIIGPKIKKWAEDRIKEFKDNFGINGMNAFENSPLYKLGKDIVKAWIAGVEVLISDVKTVGHKFVDDFVGGLVEAAKEHFGDVANIGEKIKGVFIHDGLNQHSESPDNIQAGKYEVTGVVHGMQDALAPAEEKAKQIAKDLKGKYLGEFEETVGDNPIVQFFKDIINGSGVDKLEIGTVLDTSGFENGYYDLMSKYGSTDTTFGSSSYGSSFGGYSSDLAYDVAGSSAGSTGLYGSGSTDISGLRADVQNIAARLDKIEVRMDTGALVGALYNGIDEKLGEKQILAGRGVYA